jgi:transposase
MAKGKAMSVVKQIKVLQEQGKPIRKISEILQISRNTVRRYLREAEAVVEVAATAGEAPMQDGSWKEGSWQSRLPWDEILDKHKKGYQINTLHKQYAGEEVSYWAFNRAFAKVNSFNKEDIITIPMNHKPGEKAQVDYTDGVYIHEWGTDKSRKSQLFCGVLPHSSYTFAEFTLDQKLPSFMKSHEKMWHYFGGVAPYVVPDNLKSGVTKAHLYDPVINPTFQDFANHYGFAVLPARPLRPRDKGVIESTINAIQRSFYQDVKEKKFYNIHSLNEEFKVFLNDFNNRVMKDYGVSRLDRFASERDLLLPLPRESYEFSEWRDSKVHPDCHIQVAHCYYSVPFALVSQTVRVKLTTKTVTIFDSNLSPCATHSRLSGKGKRSTTEGHLPEERVQQSRYAVVNAKGAAKGIGPAMTELFDQLFEGERPLTHLRRAQGMLRILDEKKGVKADALEYAARQCLTFQRCQTDYFRQCATTYAADQKRALSSFGAPQRQPDSACLRNPEKITPEEMTHVTD